VTSATTTHIAIQPGTIIEYGSLPRDRQYSMRV
jgi:hypothetical protein